MNLFEYLKSNCGHIVNEAVQIKNLDRTVKIIKDLLAKKKIYSSDTYRQLEKESTKLWHLGPIALYQMMTETKE